jgi:drug/metabolite transporter (DMT)-like permease
LPLLPIAALVFAVLVFTGGFASARMYFEAGGGAADVVTLRYGVSGLLFIPFVIWSRARLAAHPGWRKGLALAATGGVSFGGCVMIGISGAPFSHGGAIVPSLAMAVGSVAAWAWLGEPMGGRRITGMVLTLCGLAVLIVPQAGYADVTWWGELAYFGAGLCWAAFTVSLRAFRISPLDGAALAAFFSLPYLAVYFVYLEPQIFNVPVAATLTHGFYQGVMFNMVAIGIYGWAVSKVGAAAAVAMMPLMPLFATFMEWGIFGREPHTTVWPALVLMGLGITLSALASKATPT